MKRAKIRSASVLALVVILLGSAIPAQAVTERATASAGIYTRLINVWTDRCVDDSFAEGLRAYGCNGSDSQIWHLYRWDWGTYQVRNEHTNRCLDDSYAFGLRAIACNVSESQNWYGEFPEGDGLWQLRNQWRPYRCLDDSYTAGLREHDCNGSQSQRWHLPG